MLGQQWKNSVKPCCLRDAWIVQQRKKFIKMENKIWKNMIRKLIHLVEEEEKGHFQHHPEQLQDLILLAPLSTQFLLVSIRRFKALMSARSCLKPFLPRTIAYRSHWVILSHHQRMQSVEPYCHTFMDWCKEEDSGYLRTSELSTRQSTVLQRSLWLT